MSDMFMSGQVSPWWESGPLNTAPSIEPPPGWGYMETHLFIETSSWNRGILNDQYAMHWFHEGLFNTRGKSSWEIEELQRELKEYLWDEYEIEFDSQFNWDDYREWYKEFTS